MHLSLRLLRFLDYSDSSIPPIPPIPPNTPITPITPNTPIPPSGWAQVPPLHQPRLDFQFSIFNFQFFKTPPAP